MHDPGRPRGHLGPWTRITSNWARESAGRGSSPGRRSRPQATRGGPMRLGRDVSRRFGGRWGPTVSTAGSDAQRDPGAAAMRPPSGTKATRQAKRRDARRATRRRRRPCGAGSVVQSMHEDVLPRRAAQAHRIASVSRHAVSPHADVTVPVGWRLRGGVPPRRTSIEDRWAAEKSARQRFCNFGQVADGHFVQFPTVDAEKRAAESAYKARNAPDVAPTPDSVARVAAAAAALSASTFRRT